MMVMLCMLLRNAYLLPMYLAQRALCAIEKPLSSPSLARSCGDLLACKLIQVDTVDYRSIAILYIRLPALGCSVRLCPAILKFTFVSQL